MPADPAGSHVVYVLGAGASLAQAQARRPVQRREHPPLDLNFFQQVAQWRRDSYRDEAGASLYTRVERHAATLGERDLAGSAPPVALEDFLGRLYFNVHHDPETTSVRDYFTLVDLYAREVIATTEWMIASRPAKRDAEWLRRMLQRDLAGGCRISIITFNIDLLIENTLQILSSSRPGAAWGIGDAYGFSERLETLSGPGLEFSYDGPTEIPLFKMHGSVNWMFHTQGYYPPADLMVNRRKLYQILNRELGTRRYRHQTGKKGPNWMLFPLVVPPVYEKHQLIRTHLHEVWAGAEAALREADRVVFWGYSFPQADTHARHFFSAMAEANPALRRPTMINPDPGVATEAWKVLKVEHVSHYRHALSYMT